MRPANTVMLDSHALATLRYIRASMDAARTVAVPGSAGVAVGAIGIAAAILTGGALHPYWLATWIGAAVAGACAGAFLLAQQTLPRGFALSGTPVRKVFLHLLPSLGAGAVLTLVLYRSGDAHAIPGMWLLLYGCALLHASAVTTRIIAVLGGIFMALALLAFVASDAVQTILMGVGFGAVHLSYGALMMVRKTHGSKN
jgi:hypothetical protein